VIIRIFHNEHSPSHFHAEYAGSNASISIETLEVLVGSLPRRALVLVLDWGCVAPAGVEGGLGIMSYARKQPKKDSNRSTDVPCGLSGRIGRASGASAPGGSFCGRPERERSSWRSRIFKESFRH